MQYNTFIISEVRRTLFAPCSLVGRSEATSKRLVADVAWLNVTISILTYLYWWLREHLFQPVGPAGEFLLPLRRGESYGPVNHLWGQYPETGELEYATM